FARLVVVGGAISVIDASTTGSHDITFTRCMVYNPTPGRNICDFTSTADTAANWLWDSCLLQGGNSSVMSVTATTSTVADYDLNLVFRNCVHYHGTIL